VLLKCDCGVVRGAVWCHALHMRHERRLGRGGIRPLVSGLPADRHESHEAVEHQADWCQRTVVRTPELREFVKRYPPLAVRPCAPSEDCRSAAAGIHEINRSRWGGGQLLVGRPSPSRYAISMSGSAGGSGRSGGSNGKRIRNERSTWSRWYHRSAGSPVSVHRQGYRCVAPGLLRLQHAQSDAPLDQPRPRRIY
jgi:hypothetical protein